MDVGGDTAHIGRSALRLGAECLCWGRGSAGSCRGLPICREALNATASCIPPEGGTTNNFARGTLEMRNLGDMSASHLMGRVVVRTGRNVSVVAEGRASW